MKHIFNWIVYAAWNDVVAVSDGMVLEVSSSGPL